MNTQESEATSDPATLPFDDTDKQNYDRFADEKAQLLFCYSVISVLITLAARTRWWYISEDRYEQVVGTNRTGIIPAPTNNKNVLQRERPAWTTQVRASKFKSQTADYTRQQVDKLM